MKPVLYILLFFVIPASVKGQVFYEQIAFDYFKEVISDSVYCNKTIFRVEPEIVEYSPIYRPVCHQNDLFREDWKNLLLMDSSDVKTIEGLTKTYKPNHQFVDNNKSPKLNFKTRASKGKQVRKVNVTEPVVLKEGFYIITVMVHIPHGLENYYIEVSKEGAVIKWCKGGVIY